MHRLSLRTRRLSPLAFSVIVTAILPLLWLPGSGADTEADAPPGRIDPVDSSAHNSEIAALNERIEKLEKATPSKEPPAAGLDDFGARLDELEALAERLRRQQSREDALVDLVTQAASQSLSNVSGTMTLISILFAVVLFGASLFAGQRTAEIKRSIKKASMKVHGIGETTEALKTDLASELNRVTTLANSVEHRNSKLGLFLDNLIEVHSSAIVELLGSLSAPSRSPSKRTERLQLKGQELKGRLLLLHPRMDRRREGALLLSAVGTSIAKVDLVQLRENEETDKEMALLIESAIRTIDKRENPSGG